MIYENMKIYGFPKGHCMILVLRKFVRKCFKFL
jgi:hypothetical protein